MKKILVITSGILPMPPVEGGAVENLLQTYIENEKNIKFIVYSCAPKNNIHNEFDNIEYRYINTKKLIFKIVSKFWAIFNILSSKKIGNYFIHKIKKDIKRKKEVYDLLLIENFPIFVLPFKKLFYKKIILHVHNDWLNKYTKNAFNIKNACKNIYVVSEYVKRRVIEIDNDSSNVVLLMNGIDNKRFQKSVQTQQFNKLKEDYNISNNDLVFMYSGKLNENKGADLLLDAFLKFSKNKDDVKLLLVGSSFNLNAKDSPVLKQMKNLALESEKVIFTGFIDYKQIHQMYLISDIQIVPSQIEDSCPLVVLEGLCSGKALIVSDSGGIPELVNEKCAIIIKRNSEFRLNLQKSMQKLYDNRNLIKKMKKESFSISKKYTNTKYINRFSELIREDLK